MIRSTPDQTRRCARPGFALLLLAAALPLRAAEWVQTNVPLWGLEQGLRFALHPAGFGPGAGGPRGLVRVGAPVLPGGGHAPVDDAILTATMGNMVRTRRLWLADATLHCRALYPDFSGNQFAPHREFPLARIARTAAGDAIAAITCDEPDPASVVPFPGRPFWRYAGAPVTQYWKVPGAEVASDLRVVVNARAEYWMSREAIPGGPAFENFEMRTRFREGQVFIFGVSRSMPGGLIPGVGMDDVQSPAVAGGVAPGDIALRSTRSAGPTRLRMAAPGQAAAGDGTTRDLDRTGTHGRPLETARKGRSP